MSNQAQPAAPGLCRCCTVAAEGGHPSAVCYYPHSIAELSDSGVCAVPPNSSEERALGAKGQGKGH